MHRVLRSAGQLEPPFVPIDQQVIADQLEATTAAYGAASGAPSVLDTVKIGMLGSPATISTVAAALAGAAFKNVVLDPVLICKGQEPGHALDTDQALKAQILPLATFVTPNHFEAESLSGLKITDLESLKAAAVRIHELSGAAVLAKGGVRLAGRTPSTSTTTAGRWKSCPPRRWGKWRFRCRLLAGRRRDGRAGQGCDAAGGSPDSQGVCDRRNPEPGGLGSAVRRPLAGRPALAPRTTLPQVWQLPSDAPSRRQSSLVRLPLLPALQIRERLR